MAVSIEKFGKYPDGRDIMLYTLSNQAGMQAALTNLGAVLVKLMVPDKEGKAEDVVLGFDKGEDYLVNGSYFGAVIGPSANRIANAAFEIDGVRYQLDVNDGKNNLHSHAQDGYHKRLWDVATTDNSVTFELQDGGGSMGFPGNKKIRVTYTLEEDNTLRLSYYGESDKKTVLNLTNHTYFNLEGHDSGNMEDHELWMGASCYTPADAGSIPTGEVATVKDTPMDFTVSKKIGKEIGEDFVQLTQAKGYDHNWVVDDWNGQLKHVATTIGPKSGRKMLTFTTLPGVQFYAGNCIAPQTGKNGTEYGPRMGLCLETQYYPDSVNHANFPSCVFGDGRAYESVTEYRFEF